MGSNPSIFLSAVIDRIEGQVAVLEIASMTVEVAVADLPVGAVEGTWLRLSADVSDFLVDLQATAAARAEIEELQRKAFDGDDGGDIEL
jgi:hypothetical protein